MRVNPRGKSNLELRPVVLRTERWGALAKAGVSYKFACAEAMAVVCGWNDVAWLKRFNPRIAEFSDDGKTFHGSYGIRMNYQMNHALERLKMDKDSRQAVVNIWLGADSWTTSKDLPCNTQVYLKIRNNALDLTVMRRSADIVWGVPYDHHVFFALLHVLAAELNVNPGYLTEFIDSFHVYDDGAGFYDKDRIEKALHAEHMVVPHWWDFKGKTWSQARDLLHLVRRCLEENITDGHPLKEYLA